MDVLSSLPAFLIAVVIVAITPGPAVALIVRRTAVGGLRRGVATTLGLEIGLYVWALLVASGFAVVAASELGYLVLKIVGCVVLGWLAIRSFAAWWRQRSRPSVVESERAPLPDDDRRSLLRAAGEGLVVQMANPKAAIFLLALYPQFVPADRPLFATTAVLGLLQVAVETTLYIGLACSVCRARGWFDRSVVRRRLEAVTGSVMVALGVRLALSDR